MNPPPHHISDLPISYMELLISKNKIKKQKQEFLTMDLSNYIFSDPELSKEESITTINFWSRVNNAE